MKKYLILALLLVLSGCSLHPDPEIKEADSVAWVEHRQQLQTLSHWTLSGKLAMFIGKERQSANLYWQQEGDDYTIELTSFIGTRVMRIEKKQQSVEIINNDGETFTGENAETLIAKLAPGVAFPVAALQQWVKGNPIDASYQLNEQQLVSHLLGKDSLNNLWSVNLAQYKSNSGMNLPYKLDLTRGEVRIKIAINRWKVLESKLEMTQ